MFRLNEVTEQQFVDTMKQMEGWNSPVSTRCLIHMYLVITHSEIPIMGRRNFADMFMLYKAGFFFRMEQVDIKFGDWLDDLHRLSPHNKWGPRRYPDLEIEVMEQFDELVGIAKINKDIAREIL